MGVISAKSKKFDQLYVSRAEFNDHPGAANLKKIGELFIKTFETVYRGAMGNSALVRLRNSSLRAHRSTLGYALDTLFK